MLTAFLYNFNNPYKFKNVTVTESADELDELKCNVIFILLNTKNIKIWYLSKVNYILI